MIVAVCADKGAPGVTTLAIALAAAWPGERLLLEADASGADLPFRLKAADGGPFRSDPTVLSLAADARTGLPAGELPRYAQASMLGVPVIPGALSAEAYQPMRSLWTAVAHEAARWPGAVIADLGRFQPGHPAVAVAQAARTVLVLARPTFEGMYHLRDRVTELARLLGDPARENHPLSVVVLADHRSADQAVSQVRQMLDAAGSPVPVAGVVAEDPQGVEALQTGHLKDRALARSSLMRSAGTLVEHIRAGSFVPEPDPAWAAALDVHRSGS